jgi:colanic acid biosynthesis protein WcaH
MRLDDKSFAVVAKSAPLVSIDLILRDPDGTVFVGLRNNEPAKGFYFVPGGVIRKNEAFDDAFQRILAAETGLSATRSTACFVGVYEHFYSANRFGDPTYGTHYVVLGYELALLGRPIISLDSQHSAYRWLSEDQLLSASDVHENTKAYFRRHASSDV